jgi:hypothetical protein
MTKKRGSGGERQRRKNVGKLGEEIKRISYYSWRRGAMTASIDRFLLGIA